MAHSHYIDFQHREIITSCTPKHEERDKLSEEVDKFLSSGGEIECVERRNSTDNTRFSAGISASASNRAQRIYHS